MIKNLKIQNYKLFKSFELKDIPKILLIGGKNNCGKTTVLESLFMPLDCGNPFMFTNHLGWRGLSTFNNNAESLFAPAFHNFKLDNLITFEYSISSSKKKLSYKFHPMMTHSITVQKEKIELQKMDNELGRVDISYGIGETPNKAVLKLNPDGLNLSDVVSLAKYNEDMRAVFAHSNSHLSEEDSKRYGELDRTNRTEEIVKSLQILEPKLKSLSSISMGGKSVIYGDIGIGVKIPISLMGQGMTRLLCILLAIFEAKKGIVLIDEMENGFHHSVLPSVWEAISSYAQSNGTQIVATTHSWELISAVGGIPKELRDDFKYMRIERNKDDFKTKIYHFENLKVALGAELEVR